MTFAHSNKRATMRLFLLSLNSNLFYTKAKNADVILAYKAFKNDGKIISKTKDQTVSGKTSQVLFKKNFFYST